MKSPRTRMFYGCQRIMALYVHRSNRKSKGHCLLGVFAQHLADGPSPAPVPPRSERSTESRSVAPLEAGSEEGPTYEAKAPLDSDWRQIWHGRSPLRA